MVNSDFNPFCRQWWLISAVTQAFRSPKVMLTLKADITIFIQERVKENRLIMTNKLKVVHVKMANTKSIR